MSTGTGHAGQVGIDGLPQHVPAAGIDRQDPVALVLQIARDEGAGLLGISRHAHDRDRAGAGQQAPDDRRVLEPPPLVLGERGVQAKVACRA